MQLQEGNAVFFAFAGAVVLVFLVLAAQYESYSLPLAMILVVPMCLLCARWSAWRSSSRTSTSSCRSGFIVLVGLACKNAILIVAFAKANAGRGPVAVRRHGGRLPQPSAADHHDLASPSSWAWCR